MGTGTGCSIGGFPQPHRLHSRATFMFRLCPILLLHPPILPTVPPAPARVRRCAHLAVGVHAQLQVLAEGLVELVVVILRGRRPSAAQQGASDPARMVLLLTPKPASGHLQMEIPPPQAPSQAEPEQQP